MFRGGFDSSTKMESSTMTQRHWKWIRVGQECMWGSPSFLREFPSHACMSLYQPGGGYAIDGIFVDLC